MAEAAPSRETASVAAHEPWPATARFGDHGLEVGGLAAADLAERFGTPLIVVDEGEVRSRMRSAREAFPRVAYAVKAFTAHTVIRAALDEGLDLLCSSGGEVEACLRAGSPAESIVLHGNAKSDEELAAAVRNGVGLVVADGPEELSRLDRTAGAARRMQPVLLRVIPEVEVRTHEAIATGHAASKFGTPLGEAPEAARHAATLQWIRLDGYHAHAGSQVLEIESFMQVLDTLVELADAVRRASGFQPRVIDVGGGFGVTYTDEAAPSLPELGARLRARLDASARARGLVPPTLLVEPGRSLVANAAVTLYRVAGRKRVGGDRTLLAVDGGMGDNPRPMLYDAVHAVAPAGRPGRPARTERVTIVGRHCESGDVLAEDVELPADLDRGALVALAATGAYTYSLASTYNRFGRPAVVGVRAGRANLWLRREDAADMDRLEAGTGRVEPDGVEPPEGVEVRPARPGDARSYRTMWSAVVAEGGWVRTEEVRHPVREYRRRFRRPWTADAVEIVAVDAGDRVVGYVGLARERHPATRHVATLGLAVAADRRGIGIGSALLASGFAWARAYGVEKIVLSVYPANTQAIALYRKFGFLEEGRLSRQSRKSYGYEDEILMAAWTGQGAGGEDRVRPE